MLDDEVEVIIGLIVQVVIVKWYLTDDDYDEKIVIDVLELNTELDEDEALDVTILIDVEVMVVNE